MAVHKVSFLALLLLFGIFLLVSKVEHADAKACTKECDTRIAYVFCYYSGKNQISPICTNCCAGKKGCMYFSANGTFICEGESEWGNNKVENDLEKSKPCTLNCDPRVAYMTCPSLGLAKLNQVCVNCCMAGEGCKLYGYDGSLICTEEVKSY
ncbi:hypothetical protein RND71_028291 [Anisodus tanguticus]|uniref:Proteinase inhibitor type-2 CEVI57 n=1 Tax=Anisodus tanguticus TaxID=243964 RepID=A0AAE1RKX7_9SOLA|nr:hypothetical protein RND71_028291 [Anisodus tanguticus]